MRTDGGFSECSSGPTAAAASGDGEPEDEGEEEPSLSQSH